MSHGGSPIPWLKCFLLLTCATIASCDDFDDIVAWSEHHLDFLRKFAPYHHGVPCERWLRTLVNRVDPVLFGRCFEGWIKALWPGRHEAVSLFCYQVKKWIGAFAAALGGLDTLVFAVRARICDGLGFLGIELDEKRNAANDGVISAAASRVPLRVIRTDEELMIAKMDCRVLGLG